MDPYVTKVTWQASSAQRVPVRVNPVWRHPAERVVSLDGPWQFELDPDDEGVRRGWFKKPRVLKGVVEVPGCWQGQGYGHEGTDKIWDFQIETRVFRATYTGTGWYGKSFQPPADWADRRLWLAFGGVHPSAEVWLNGQRLGSHSAPFVPFAFDVTDAVRPGRDNWLTIRVHERNRWLGLAYNWTGNWSGLFRGVELIATGPCWLDRFAVQPDVDGQRLRLRPALGGATREPMTLTVSAGPAEGAPVAEVSKRIAPGREHAFDLPVPTPRLWSPDAPHLYRVDAVLRRGDEVLDATSERVGFVKLAGEGKQFLINGEPYYMRGTGDFAVSPETGSPDTCRGRWREKLQTLRDYGYNHVRCQSYVPTPEYYDAADEVGLLVQGEMGMLGAWSGHSAWHHYGWPRPTPQFREALRWQWNHTVTRDVNHPSANLYCMSNELGYHMTLFPRVATQCYRETRAIKPSAFVIWTDGGYDKHVPSDFVNAEVSRDDAYDLPLIRHEFRWWSSFPDVRAKRKYSGAVRPYAIEVAERATREHGLGRLLPTMAENSQRLQYIEARTKMESCRRDYPWLAGISHFTAMDIGLSPQGIIDEFYGKKHVDAPKWRQTNGDTIVMIDRDFDDRVLVGGTELRCALSVSDFSHPPLECPVLDWKLTVGKRVWEAGRTRFRHRAFCTCPAGRIRAALPRVSRPAKMVLRATIREGKRTFRNQWDFWLLPAEPRMPGGVAVYGTAKHTWLRSVKGMPRLKALGKGKRPPRVLLAETLDGDLAAHMHRGGRVVLAAPEGLLRPFYSKLGLPEGDQYFFLPPANYPPHDDGHTGSIISDHPMLGKLPHDGFADLQFYRLIRNAPPVDLEPLGLGRVEPVIRATSTYFVGLPLAYLAEVAVGKGGLVICSLGLDQKLPEARYLLASILNHASGRSFRPKKRLSRTVIKQLIAATGS